MKNVYVFFAEGFEEIEALTVVDLLRRADVSVKMTGISGEGSVTGSHGICVGMDTSIDEVSLEEAAMLVLPGGMPGTKNLEAHEGLMAQVDAYYAGGKYVADICAAPSIFGHRGILKGRRACCYPGIEAHLEGAEVTAGPVEIADNVITSRGMGTAMDFALAIVEVLCGKEKAQEMAEAVVHQR